MLRVDLWALDEGPADTVADVAPTDPELADVEFELGEQVHVTGRLSESGPGSYYWDGRVRTTAVVACRRCLTPLRVPIDERVRLVFTEDDSADDSSMVVIPREATQLDLGDAIREALILAEPEYALCRDDCRGLCPDCGKDLNEGPCDCRPAADPRWAALDALKSRPETETE